MPFSTAELRALDIDREEFHVRLWPDAALIVLCNWICPTHKSSHMSCASQQCSCRLQQVSILAVQDLLLQWSRTAALQLCRVLLHALLTPSQHCRALLCTGGETTRRPARAISSGGWR